MLANQVRFKENVDLCLEIVDRLLDREEPLAGRVSILFMQAQIEDLGKFIPIIKKILAKPKIRGKTLYHIFEYLEKCLLANPLTVFEMLEEILLNVGEDFYNIVDYIPASHSKAPLNIVNTILDLPSPSFCSKSKIVEGRSPSLGIRIALLRMITFVD